MLIAKMSVREERPMDKDVRDSFSKSTEMDTRSVVSTQAEWRVDSKYGVDTWMVLFVNSKASLTILLNRVTALVTN